MVHRELVLTLQLKDLKRHGRPGQPGMVELVLFGFPVTIITDC